MGNLEPEFSKRARQANKIDRHGMTALMWAAVKGKAKKVRELLSSGAEIDFAKTEKSALSMTDYPAGATALHFAAWHGHTDVVKMLVEKGADVNAVDEKGFSPLDLALARQVDTDETKEMKDKSRLMTGWLLESESKLKDSSAEFKAIAQTLMDAGAATHHFSAKEDAHSYVEKKRGLTKRIVNVLGRKK